MNSILTAGPEPAGKTPQEAPIEVPVAGPAAPNTQPPPDPAIETYLQQLESDDFETRETATRRLIFLGKDSVSAVERSTLEGGPETRARAISIFEQMLLKGDLETVQLADDALQRLQQCNKPEVTRRVEGLFQTHRDLIEKRTLEAFQSLGGKVLAPSSMGSAFLMRGFPGQNRWGTTQINLFIGENYRGTQKDLLKLRNIRITTIFFTANAKLDAQTVQQLLQSIPNLTFMERSEVRLGIEAIKDEIPLIVKDVSPDSTAQLAGIQSGDEILAIDGKKISDLIHAKPLNVADPPPPRNGFEALVSQLKLKHVGDRMTFTIRREDPKSRSEENPSGFQTLDVTGTLKGW